MKLIVAFLLLAVMGAQAAFPVHPRFFHSDAQAFVEDSYIVVLNQSATSHILENIVSRFPAFKTYKIAETFKAFAAKLTQRQLEILLNEPFVDFVEPDQLSFASLCTKRQGPVSWGQDRVTAPGPNDIDDQLHYNSNDGSGVNVYVIDTGIQIEHEDFQPNRAIWGYNAVAGSSNTDKNGHGTHVASTSIGNTWGFAKAATAYAVKVLGDNGSGTNSGVIDGVNWAANHRRDSKKPGVANMSLGGGASAALDAAVKSAISSGLLMAVAAGNDNVNACNGSPARETSAITVGATTLSVSGSTQIDARSSFSNFGSCVNIFAPGTAITAAWIGASNKETRTISGTSMASPHVAGIIAVHLGQNPSYTQNDMFTLLVDNAQKNIISLGCSGASATVCNASPNTFLHRPDC